MLTAERICQLATRLGTIEDLELVTAEILVLNEHLVDDRRSLSRDQIVEIQDALAMLGRALAEMNRVSHGMLQKGGLRGLDYVG
jgi:hypothetical protein